MKVFLTGGTGYIGQVLTRQLLARGWQVSALVRRPQSPSAVALQNMGVTLVEGDILDVDSMRSGMAGADILIHNAGMYEVGLTAKGKKQMYAINVAGTDRVLGLAKALKIPRTVYVSTTWVYGITGAETADETFQRKAPFRTYYEETKTKAHELALKYQTEGLPLIIVCPHGVVGPNDHSVLGYIVRSYLNRMLPPFGWSPNAVFTFVYLDDLAEGIALAAEKGGLGETYILAGEAMQQRDMLATWATQPGGFKTRFFLPAPLMALMFGSMVPLLRLVGLPAFLSRETVQIGGANFAFSSQKAKDQLGWTHRSARQLWLDTIAGELELKKQRKTRNPIAKLKPI